MSKKIDRKIQIQLKEIEENIYKASDLIKGIVSDELENLIDEIAMDIKYEEESEDE